VPVATARRQDLLANTMWSGSRQLRGELSQPRLQGIRAEIWRASHRIVGYETHRDCGYLL